MKRTRACVPEVKIKDTLSLKVKVKRKIKNHTKRPSRNKQTQKRHKHVALKQVQQTNHTPIQPCVTLPHFIQKIFWAISCRSKCETGTLKH
mgnify:CR=1 FL=1